jgi:TPR repeat protein
MKCSHRVCLRRLSLFMSMLIACIVIAGPTGPVYGMDLNQLQAMARQGYVAQQLELGEAYLTGKGVPRSAADAAYWYEKAAHNGNAEAQNLVGYMYQSGLGVPANSAQAVRWYQLSAASGCSDAMINLGVLHMMGIGVPKDATRASEYFQKAVNHGNGTGAAYLGTMAYSGIGMNQDKDAAEHWFTVGQKLHDPISPRTTLAHFMLPSRIMRITRQRQPSISGKPPIRIMCPRCSHSEFS